LEICLKTGNQKFGLCKFLKIKELFKNCSKGQQQITQFTDSFFDDILMYSCYVLLN